MHKIPDIQETEIRKGITSSRPALLQSVFKASLGNSLEKTKAKWLGL